MKSRIIIVLVVAAITLSHLSNAQVPRVLSYQGFVGDSQGIPKPDGSYSFTFRLYTASTGGSAIWTESKTLPVKSGLFSTVLGQITSLDAIQFDQQYWLGVQVSPDAEYSPRVQITASAYSMTSIVSDTARFALQPWQLDGTSAFYNSGNVGIGTNTPEYPLTFGNSTGNDKISLWTNYGTHSYYGLGVGSYQIQVHTDIPEADVVFGSGTSASFNESARIKGSGVLQFPATEQKKITLYPGSTGEMGLGVAPSLLKIYADNPASDIAFGYDQAGSFAELTRIRGNGNVGIGISNPGSKLVVVDEGNNGLRVQTNSQGGTLASFGGSGDFKIDAPGLDGGRMHIRQNGKIQFGQYPYDPFRPWLLPFEFFSVWDTGNVGAGFFNLKPGGSVATFGVYGDFRILGGVYDRLAISEAGDVGISVPPDPSARVSIKGADGQPGLLVTSNAGSNTIVGINQGYGNGVTGIGIGGGVSGVYGRNDGGGYGVFGRTTGGGTAVFGDNTDASGYAGYFTGRVSSNILEIRGGSDLAEPFSSEDEESVEPGTLMVIDENHPGKLRVSDQEYDPKIAGIVSGAGGIRPGLTLQQDGVTSGPIMVAIAGRVYCMADATNCSIQPGDLLTSSSTPGHVMKATNNERSNGTIVGKAMSTLNEGTGLVLVLVNLQ